MKIVIEVVAGRLNVAGDAVLQDKIATLGLIELAKTAILAQPAPQPGVEVPHPALAKRLLGGEAGANGHGHGG